MPSTITHAYFGLDVLSKLDKKTKDNLTNYKEHLKVFSQGPDFFYFYNLNNLKKGKDIQTFGGFIHNNKTQEFFILLIEYIKENHLQNDFEVISFLYGFINHYVLDSITHPFIFYKTGIYNKTNKSTWKYRGLHEDMESYIDAYFIFQNERRMPHRFHPHKFCFNISSFSENLNKTINTVFKKVYNKENIADIYYKCIKQSKTFNYIYRYDKSGLKKKLYKLIDLISPNYFKKKTFLSYYQDIDPKKHYLNLEKNEWKHPTNENEISNLSFVELYIIAINKAVNIINNINNILYNDGDINNLPKIFDNTSYLSGKNCDLKESFSVFEF